MIEHLDAKRAYIEHLTFKVQEAGHRKADIGYHFRLKDPNACDDFEEGDVVGFYKDDDGHSSIQLLDNKNGKDAFMAGVISRSAYLEATPPMNENGLFKFCFFKPTAEYEWGKRGVPSRLPKGLKGWLWLSLPKYPLLLALPRWGRFARRNVCDSVT